MKRVILAIIALSCISTMKAQQKIEKHLSYSDGKAIHLNLQIADSIRIRTWEKNEVLALASVSINDNKDNEAYRVSFDEEADRIGVNADFSRDYFRGKNNCRVESDIYWQVFIPDRANFSVETINADVTITGNTDKMKVKSISGDIDLAVPATKPADLEFSTISGTVYSNLNLSPERFNKSIPSRIKEKLNNGGPLIQLETISGNIFFRKSD